MRITVELITNKIPLSGHRYLILSLIKNVLQKENPSLFREMYENHEDYQFRTKSFTYALKLNDFKFVGDEIELEGNAVITISTPDIVLGSTLYNAFLLTKNYNYSKEYNVEIGRVNVLKEKTVNSNVVLFKTLSPICIKDSNGEFLKIDNPNYEKELNYFMDKVLESYRGSGLKEQLIFEPILMTKRVAKEKIAKFTERTNKEIFYITAYEGVFKLTGNKEDLNLIYKLGCGNRRSSGFGTLQIV
ncbi:CRISPR-associated endoribonuclease Cas6 [Clostridium gasigenes]|uniref:CRISPR-associated endoribonuclease Cas6 n=1 Tax=Clostridium gasigenes TaxID=94869 RepID=A0A7X0SA28_9CLOT|nr:CRISPR-associated endoribonuclease Cas6 [Clostridium gasigenes]MBB6713833.1 CRISPR-associated endoribonuclease Cas6 [Clostridium gasigenes]